VREISLYRRSRSCCFGRVRVNSFPARGASGPCARSVDLALGAINRLLGFASTTLTPARPRIRPALLVGKLKILTHGRPWIRVRCGGTFSGLAERTHGRGCTPPGVPCKYEASVAVDLHLGALADGFDSKGKCIVAIGLKRCCTIVAGIN